MADLEDGACPQCKAAKDAPCTITLNGKTHTLRRRHAVRDIHGSGAVSGEGFDSDVRKYLLRLPLANSSEDTAPPVYGPSPEVAWSDDYLEDVMHARLTSPVVKQEQGSTTTPWYSLQMPPTVGVAPGTVTFYGSSSPSQIPTGWQGPGGYIPASAPEPQRTFMTDPFAPQYTTPIVYIGAGPASSSFVPGCTVCAGSRAPVPLAGADVALLQGHQGVTLFNGPQGVTLLQGAPMKTWLKVALALAGVAVVGTGVVLVARR